MKKPRPYDGPVDFLAAAQEVADAWTPATSERVAAASPYLAHNCRGVRPDDWLKLVAHVSSRREEDPVVCAERLALYVSAYRERHHRTLHPDAVAEGQEP